MNRESVRAFFREKVTRPLSFKEISTELRLSRPEARSLKRVLRELVSDGTLVRTRKGLYGPSEDMSLVTGSFEAYRDGFGFVIPDKPGERDCFIPPRATLGAMNGDRVIARLEHARRREGRIIRILDRVNSRIAGRIEGARAAYTLRPRSRTIPIDFYVSPRDLSGARSGDVVIAEILSYPGGSRPPAARVVKVLDEPEDPRSEVEMIVEEFSLPRRFPPQVVSEAKRLAGLSEHPEGTGRRKDLRRLATVTIDGERARDFDDAVSIALVEQGFRLWVHIADVGTFVPWDSALDLEARRRGTSVYFPDRVIPMLPKELSENLCSLRPGIDRFAFTVEMEFDRKGDRTASSFYPSVIRSDERMTYTSVSKIIVDGDRDERGRYEGLLREFDLMAELCGILRSRRMARGSLDFDLPEPEVILDLQGSPEAIIRAERNFAHLIIEEFMVAANEAVAEHLEERGLPCVYRIHEPPDPAKMDDLSRQIRNAGGTVMRRFSAENFPALLKAIKGRPEEEVINYLILRSLKQARYATVNVGHFGLASEAYAHFTSPIRRYPDLAVHRILRESLGRKALPEKRLRQLESLLPDIAFSSSRTERRADEAEREVINAMRTWFMRGRVGEEFSGTVVGITPYGLRIRLSEHYVVGFLHVSSLADDFYQFNERTMRLSGRHTGRSFRIGQAMQVRLDRVDMEEREVHFSV